MYRSRLVPRPWPWLGLIGGPLLLIGNVGVLFDLWDQTGLVNVLVVPEFIWEAFLGIYCAIWGFRRDSPILSPRASDIAPEPPVQPTPETSASGVAPSCSDARPLRGRVRGALSHRLVRQRRRCARLHRAGSGLGDLGGGQPVEKSHRSVRDAARRLRLPALRRRRSGARSGVRSLPFADRHNLPASRSRVPSLAWQGWPWPSSSFRAQILRVPTRTPS